MGKYAIFLVLALTFSMLTYSYALRNSIFISEHRTVQSFSYSQAHNIAQSAAMLAINGIRSGDIDYKSSNPTILNEKWEDMKGEYTVIIEENPVNNQVIIHSSGTFFENENYVNGNGVQEVTYTISIGLLSGGTTTWNPNFDQAIHAEKNIDLTSGSQTLIDGDVTLNSTEASSLELGNHSGKIGGSLYVGPGGDPETVIDSPHNYDGSPGVLEKKLEYPMPKFPEFPDDGVTKTDPEGIIEFSTETLHYNNISLQGNSSLTINTGGEKDTLNIVTNSFNAGSNIEITGDGVLNLYVKNEFDLSSSINELGSPEQMWIYYHGDQDVELYDETIEMGGNTLYNGNLFADKANIRLRGTADIRGHILTGGSSVVVSGDASAVSRVIYAPNALVELNGRGSHIAKIQGSIISNEFLGNGNVEVIHNNDLEIEFPDFQVEITGYPIAWWN